ncbi:MAG: zinc-dependent alcohol dehydrogenase family protein [Planctomycetaceae bacterium]|nr:zinc-dependent alcohol dehydrogenase family protein [Planctomycetaceae bacterium]
MVLSQAGGPLVDELVPRPEPAAGELLIRVAACAVCRTDLHVVDGELPHARSRVIPGHEIVGTVFAAGDEKHAEWIGRRVGVPWLGKTCGHCWYCQHGSENLCDAPQFTGYTRDGGFAEYVVADAAYCLALPEGLSDAEAAPLLCAGLIGYRTLRIAGAAERLGIYGFGAAAHLVAQVARHEGRRVFAFTRTGDTTAQEFARRLGAVWAGGSDESPPEPLDAALIFAPVGSLVPTALKAVRKGGVVVCGGIHMSDIPAFPYELLWGERVVRSVANLTRRDGEEFLALAPKIPIHTQITTFPLDQANVALERLRNGQIEGAAVLIPPHADSEDDSDLASAKAPASPASELPGWSVAVFEVSRDRQTVATALSDALGLSPTDALIQSRHLPGVLAGHLSEAVARQAAAQLKELAIVAEPVEWATLPDFRHAMVSHHIRFEDEALDLVDQNGNLQRRLPWNDIAVIGVGLVPLETTQRVDLRDAHAITMARRSHHRPMVSSLPPVLEAWLVTRDRTVVRLDQTRMNYEALGEHKSTSAADNFGRVLGEILLKASAARHAPSTDAWRRHASIFQYLFESSEQLQRSILIAWLSSSAT